MCGLFMVPQARAPCGPHVPAVRGYAKDGGSRLFVESAAPNYQEYRLGVSTASLGEAAFGIVGPVLTTPDLVSKNGVIEWLAFRFG